MLFLSPVNYSQSRAKQEHRTGALPIENWAWTWESMQMHVEMRRSKMWQHQSKGHHLSITSCQPWVFVPHATHAAKSSMMWVRKINFLWPNGRWRHVVRLIWLGACLQLELFNLQGFYLFIYLCNLSVYFLPWLHSGCTHTGDSGPKGDCTHSNTRWPSPMWPWPTAGPGGRLDTAGSPHLPCCVGRHMPVSRPRPPSTRWRGRCTCTWQVRKQVWIKSIKVFLQFVVSGWSKFSESWHKEGGVFSSSNNFNKMKV